MPFRAAIDAGVATIMTAHVFVPRFDDDRPATLSRRVVTGLLRDEMGFAGVVLSDDLEMKAIAGDPRRAGRGRDGDRGGLRRRARSAAATTTRRRPPSRRWSASVEDGSLPRARVEDALTRQQRAKERFLTRRCLGSAAGAAAPSDRRSAATSTAPIADEMARFA